MGENNSRKDEHYFGFIYWNPDDKRMFVPKRWGYGWTPNFANPKAIAVFILILIAVFVVIKFI